MGNCCVSLTSAGGVSSFQRATSWLSLRSGICANCAAPTTRLRLPSLPWLSRKLSRASSVNWPRKKCRTSHQRCDFKSCRRSSQVRCSICSRGEYDSVSEAVQVLEAGKEFLRVAHAVDAKLERRHVAREELDLDALARRKGARGGKREGPRRVFCRGGNGCDEAENSRKHQLEQAHWAPRRIFQR